ncbi:MAG: Uma2 family endonuclease [Polyangiaceae bacterium]
MGPGATVGSDQFVYYDASNPKLCVAPDVYLRLTPRGVPIRSWKTWERGAPHVAIELVSDSDRSANDWDTKLQRYRQLGVDELLRFDTECPSGPELRVWDRVDGALVERHVEGGRAPSLVLNLSWVVAPADGFEVALRISVQGDGQTETLVPTRQEARAAEAEARKVEAEARKVEAEARKAEAEARKAAEARIRELEAELARRR